MIILNCYLLYSQGEAFGKVTLCHPFLFQDRQTPRNKKPTLYRQVHHWTILIIVGMGKSEFGLLCN